MDSRTVLAVAVELAIVFAELIVASSASMVLTSLVLFVLLMEPFYLEFWNLDTTIFKPQQNLLKTFKI